MLANKPFHGSRRSTFSHTEYRKSFSRKWTTTSRKVEILPRNFARGRIEGEQSKRKKKEEEKSGKNIAKYRPISKWDKRGGGAQAKLERIQLDLVASCILPFQCLGARYRRRRFAAGTRTRYTRVPTRPRIAYLAFYDPRAGPKSPFQRNWNRRTDSAYSPNRSINAPEPVSRALFFSPLSHRLSLSLSLFPC